MFKRILKAIFLRYGSCPNCGTAVKYGMTNGETRCSGCHKSVIIRNGEIVGTK